MSLSEQELEVAGSSGSRGWVEQIVKLESESCGRVLVGSKGLQEEQTSFREKPGVPVHLKKMKRSSVQVSSLHINMQGRHRSSNFFLTLPCSKTQLYKNNNRVFKKRQKHIVEKNAFLEQTGNLIICKTSVCVGTDHGWINSVNQNDHFGRKTNRKQH